MGVKRQLEVALTLIWWQLWAELMECEDECFSVVRNSIARYE
jgi:hypothetical protein